jgi:hypothetical protein
VGNPYRGGKMKEGTPELCRSGKAKRTMPEINRGGDQPNSSELFRPGSTPATMPEIDRGRFAGRNFVNRIRQNEQMPTMAYDSVSGTDEAAMTPGHKRMAGMP